VNYDILGVFEKEGPAKLPEYVSWLVSVQGEPRKKAALAITVNANRHYNLGLVLAYLLVTKDNLPRILNRLGNTPDMWERFPDDATLRDFGRLASSAQYVLFYDGDRSRLLGFADATVFAQELFVLRRQGRSQEIEHLLNQRGAGTVESIRMYFRSFAPDTIPAQDLFSAARTMIERRVSQAVVVYGGSPWFVNLASIIRLAT
jgi:hypothetical protein